MNQKQIMVRIIFTQNAALPIKTLIEIVGVCVVIHYFFQPHRGVSSPQSMFRLKDNRMVNRPKYLHTIYVLHTISNEDTSINISTRSYKLSYKNSGESGGGIYYIGELPKEFSRDYAFTEAVSIVADM